MSDLDPNQLSFDEDGLIPAIVQDGGSGTVLMLGYMSPTSLQRTVDEGTVTFWSRSRQQLWRKGDTSGNRLRLIDIAVDCDGDALLITAEPNGPTCHTGESSCFGTTAGGSSGRSSQGFRRLEDLWAVIADRAEKRPPGSYTASLIAGGVNATTRKLTEEATEVLLAAKDRDHAALAEEAADLIYHLLVVLAERRQTPRTMLDALERRS